MELVSMNIEGGVAFLTLNRPEKYNAFNRDMAMRLQLLLEECSVDGKVRCVVITGAGKAFCSGQDLSEVVDPNGPGMARILSEHYNPIVSCIHQMEKPIIAAVNGVAAGAGANIALCCDITVAARSASFIQAFSAIGLIPDSSGTYYLPRMIGRQKASALMMLGEKVSATEAERMGMIYQVYDDDIFEQSWKALANKLAKMPTRALGLTKLALNLSEVHSLDEQLRTEDELQQRAARTFDFAEGVKAFLEKRQPVFKGH